MREIAKEVIEKAASGDMVAFEEIYKTFSSTVYTLALNITQNSQDAEDATQDVFVKVFRALKDFKFKSSFGTWVYRIAMNTAINMYHSRSRHSKKAVGLDEIGEVPDPGPVRARSSLDSQAAGSKVESLLKNLSPEQRLCIMLREIEGLDYKEMAKVLGIPLNTVRSRLKRAREALAAYCRKEGVLYGL